MYQALQKYIPTAAYQYLVPILTEEKVFLTVKNGRLSKWGDYRSPFQGKGHRISVNGNLNEYAFLITLCHEIAHLFVWKHFGNKVKPHGKEWQHYFQNIMRPLLQSQIFPSSLLQQLKIHMKQPKASATADVALLRLLKSFDPVQQMILEDLPLGELFQLANGRVFKKGQKRRTRYLCQCQKTNKDYLIHPLAEVQFLKN